ncbi:MAG: DUF4062 domain-containing protein [Chlorobium sp.]|nr:MAG: DUF4062 domain-containing protein [Chlorobium sp.]
MPGHNSLQPRQVPQVMVSSTFTDLKEHRAALIEAINAHGFHPNVMEHDSASLYKPCSSDGTLCRKKKRVVLSKRTS